MSVSINNYGISTTSPTIPPIAEAASSTAEASSFSLQTSQPIETSLYSLLLKNSAITPEGDLTKEIVLPGVPLQNFKTIFRFNVKDFLSKFVDDIEGSFIVKGTGAFKIFGSKNVETFLQSLLGAHFTATPEQKKKWDKPPQDFDIFARQYQCVAFLCRLTLKCFYLAAKNTARGN